MRDSVGFTTDQLVGLLSGLTTIDVYIERELIDTIDVELVDEVGVEVGD